MKKNLIIFDIDGTLTDSVKIHQDAFVEALYSIGVESMDTNFKQYKHHTDSYIATYIYEKDKGEEFSDLKFAEFELSLTEKMQESKIGEIAGAKKAVDFLKLNTDFAICFATGSLRKPAIYKLNSVGIDFEEAQLVASDKIFERENILQKAIERSLKLNNRTEFERIISVGDGLWDLMTAKNLGLEFIGIGEKHLKEMEENGSTNNFMDLKEFRIG